MARSRVTKCPKCGQFTPAKGTSCLYCGTELVGLFSVEERKSESSSTPAPTQPVARPAPTPHESERTLPLKSGPSPSSQSGPLKPITEREPIETRSVARPGAAPPPDARTTTQREARPIVLPGRAPGERAPGEETQAIKRQTRPASPSAPAAAMHEEPRQLGSDKARFTKQADDRSHYLLLQSGEPVLLDPGKLFVIGRDQRAGLVLRADGVSRQHCEIDWQGDPPRAVLCEVRSRYGTFLNGRLVPRDQPQPLRDGDDIRLGPLVTVEYRYTTERTLRENLVSDARGDTREVRLPTPGGVPAAPTPPPVPREIAMPAPAFEQVSARTASGAWPSLPQQQQQQQPAAPPPPVDNGPVEEGNLIQSPPAQLLEGLYRARRTGTLSLTTAQGMGEIYVENGKAKGLTFAGATGQEALQRILALTQGAYRFRPESQRPPAPETPAPRAVATPSERNRLPSGFARTYDASTMQPQQPPPVQQPPLGYPATAAPSGYPSSGMGGYGAPPARDTMSYGAPPGGRAPFSQQTGAFPPQTGGGFPQPPGFAQGGFPQPGSPAPAPGGFSQVDDETKALITPILATIQAANLTGEGLGSFGGESAAQFLRDGALAAALEVSERVLELAQTSPPAEAAQARNALKAIMRGPHHVTRALELLQHGLATRGPAWAAPQALRLLRLFDRDMPPGFEEALKALARM